MKFEAVGTCPVPAKLADEMREVCRRAETEPVSVYRGSDPGAANILRRYGKATQAWLYRAYWVLRLPGYNPANRPKQSTHELYNDGVAYRGPVGMPLAYYKVGQDWPPSKVAAVIRAWAQIGWIATLTYPNSVQERQHINLRKEGRQFRPFLVVKRGSRGRRVGWVRYALNFVHDPDTNKPYMADPKIDKRARQYFGENLEHAVKKFQRDHHQKADGIVGKQTYRQLQAIVRHRKRKLKGRR